MRERGLCRVRSRSTRAASARGGETGRCEGCCVIGRSHPGGYGLSVARRPAFPCHAPRRRGYIAWPPVGQHGARGGSGTRRLVLRLAHALLHPLESMENDRMERGREMIGLSYRSSTREGRACRGRRVSGVHAGGTRLSRPHPVGVRPPIGRDKRVPPVSYFLRISARSGLTGRRLGAAPRRPAPRRRGYIAWPPAG